MMDLFFGSHAGWFSAPAIIGTAFFLLRLFAAGDGVEHDLHDTAAAGAGDHHADSSQGFKALSLQSVLAFMMGFGWGGLGGLRGAGWGYLVSAGFGIFCGVAMVWLLGLLLKALHDLQSSGNIAIVSAHGAVGDVYVTVPESGRGTGEVRITIENRQRLYRAVSDGDPIPTGSRVRVVAVNTDNTLTVAPK